MGLDFSHSKAHWSYSGFHRFRCRLAREIGIDLDKMAGFERLPSIAFNPVHAGLPWDNIKDPIVPFLRHSDCDGELLPAQCVEIAPRLRELVAGWPGDHDRHNVLLLADDMEACGNAGQTLEFQ